MTASISARNCSRRVTFPFWLQAIPANVRCSAILNLPTPSLDVHAFYHVERLTQSFPRGSRADSEPPGSLPRCVCPPPRVAAYLVCRPTRCRETERGTARSDRRLRAERRRAGRRARQRASRRGGRIPPSCALSAHEQGDGCAARAQAAHPRFPLRLSRSERDVPVVGELLAGQGGDERDN